MSGELRDVKVGDITAGLGRYRSYLLVLLSIGLIAVLTPGAARPPSGEDRTAALGRDGSAAVAGPQDVAPTAAAATQADPGSQAIAAARRGSATVRQTVPPAAAGSGAQQSALAPDCDPATGRIRMPATAASYVVLYPPNCVPIWPKGADNLGATYPGVTRDTITVAVYLPQEDSQITTTLVSGGGTPRTEEETDLGRDKTLEAFQAHFETYGRKVKWVKVKASGAAGDDVAARADALKVAKEIKAFASINDPSMYGGVAAYADELATRGVLCVGCTPAFPEWTTKKWQPYVWPVRPGPGMIHDSTAEYIGKTLANRPARYAGDPLLAAKNRVFGLIQYNTADGAYNGVMAYLDRQLRKYGTRVTDWAEQTLDLNSAQEQSRVIIAKLKDKGVSTVLCWCDPLMPIFFTQEATRQQYFPEWLSIGSYLMDHTFFGRLYDQAQWRNGWAIAIPGARLDPDSPEWDENLVWWHHGEELYFNPFEFTYWGILFTGIHLAGPKLTPETFRDGLFAMKPASGYITRPAVSFGKSYEAGVDFGLTDDVTLMWWDAQVVGPDELNQDGAGMYRYVDMGRRYLPGQWPNEIELFDAKNTITMYDKRPPQDVLPGYEHKRYRGTG